MSAQLLANEHRGEKCAVFEDSLNSCRNAFFLHMTT